MLWSYLKSILIGTLILVTLIAAFEFVFYLLPKLTLVVVGVALIWFACWLIKKSWEQHKYYVQHIKPGEDSYNNAMRQYWKACRATAWTDLKQSWAEFRGRKTTP